MLPMPCKIVAMKNFGKSENRNLLKGKEECQFIDGQDSNDFRQMTEFFCGHEEKCTGKDYI